MPSLLDPIQSTPYVGGASDGDLSVVDGLQYVRQNNLAAVAAPTVNADASAGYVVGSTWINVAAGSVYTCVDSTNSAAVWKSLSDTGSPAGVGTEIQYRNGTSFGAITNSSYAGNVVTLPNLVVSDLTATRIPYVGTAGRLVDSNLLTFSPASGHAVISNSGNTHIQFSTNTRTWTLYNDGQTGLPGNLIANSGVAYFRTASWTAAAITDVPIGINLALNHSADAIQVTSYGGTNLFRVDSLGLIHGGTGTYGGFLKIDGTDGFTSSGGSLNTFHTICFGAKSGYYGYWTVSNGMYGWTDTGSTSIAAWDTALARNAAGVIEVNNGTAGQYRDVKLRNLISDSGYFGISATGNGGTSSVGEIYSGGRTGVLSSELSAGKYNCIVHGYDGIKLSTGNGSYIYSTRVTIDGTGATTINATSGNPLTVQANSVTKLIVDNTGSVGIGVISTTAVLNIVGDGINNAGRRDGIHSVISDSNNSSCAGYFSSGTANAAFSLKTGQGSIIFGEVGPSNIDLNGYLRIACIANSLYGNLFVGDNTNYNVGGQTGGQIVFGGDDVIQGYARATFAMIRGIKENASYNNALGALVFGTQSTSTGASGLPTVTEKMRIASDGKVGIGTTSPSAHVHAISTTEQLRLGYNTTNYFSTTIASNGDTTFTLTGTNPSFIFISNGKAGFNTTVPDKQVEINSVTGDCLRLTYNDSNGSAAYKVDHTVDSSGRYTIAPSGGTTTFAGIVGTKILSLVSTATNDDPQLDVYQNRVTTVNNTTATLHTIAIADETSYRIYAAIECRCYGGASGNTGKSGGFEFIGRVRRTAAGIAILGTVTSIYSDQDGTGWSATLDVDGGNNARIRVTGGATDDVVWHLVELKVSPVST